MSDRSRRRRSPSRGRSESRGRSPPLEYTETTRTITTRHKYATESECYRNYYQADFDQTVETTSDERPYESDEDSADGDNDDDRKSRRREIMDKIWDLADPGSELEKLVREYDNESDNTDDEETDGEETDESEYDNEESETDHNDSENDNHDDDDKNHDEKEKN